MSEQGLIIGTSGAGKTCLIASLFQGVEQAKQLVATAEGGPGITKAERAGAKSRLKERGIPVGGLHLLHLTEAARGVEKHASRILANDAKDGNWAVPGSIESARIGFTLLAGRGKGMEFSFLDTPGGALFMDLGRDMDDLPKNLRDALHDQQKLLNHGPNLVICVDANNQPDQGARLHQGLKTLINKLAAHGLKMASVQICLTKAESYAWEQAARRFRETGRKPGASHSSWLEKQNPWTRIMEILPHRSILNDLSKVVKKKHLTARWVSAYGFDGKGNAAIDAADSMQGNRVEHQLIKFRYSHVESSELMKVWQPYGVVETFLTMQDGKRRQGEWGYQ